MSATAKRHRASIATLAAATLAPKPARASAGRPVTAHDVLTAASDTIRQRGQQRDSSAGTGTHAPQERSMAATVAAFNAIEGTSLTERQGWAFMQTLKLVRAAASDRNGMFNPDDSLDGAAYAALGGEAAAAAAGMTVQQP